MIIKPIEEHSKRIGYKTVAIKQSIRYCLQIKNGMLTLKIDFPKKEQFYTLIAKVNLKVTALYCDWQLNPFNDDSQDRFFS